MSRSLRGKRVLIAVALAAATTSAVAATRAAPVRVSERSVYALANRCLAVRSAGGRASGPYYLKPTGLGTFLLYQRDGRLRADSGGTTTTAGSQAQWRITPDRARTAYEIRATATGARASRGALHPAPGIGVPSVPGGGNRRDRTHVPRHQPQRDSVRVRRRSPAHHGRHAGRRRRDLRAGVQPIWDRSGARPGREDPRQERTPRPDRQPASNRRSRSALTTRTGGRRSPAGRPTTHRRISRCTGGGSSGRGRRASG